MLGWLHEAADTGAKVVLNPGAWSHYSYARIADGAQEVESLALYNGQRTLLLSVQKAQDENKKGFTQGF